MKCRLQLLVILLVGVIGFNQVSAAEANETPDVLVDRITREVMTVIKTKSDTLESEPEVFYSEVGNILNAVVAFDYISHGVMGNYARQASAQQRQRFNEVFQTNLISTYAKGMVVYADLQIDTQPLDSELGDSRKATVVQQVKGEDSDNTVVYSLGKSKVDNQWKVLNVIINGVNLGSTFRSQFAQAMKKYGDIDKVIENWAS